jgi:nucleoside-diphosphate-sugar epimerase
MSHRIFITGAGGYIGAMLVDIMSEREDVDAIIGLDKNPCPEFIKENKKLTYIQANTADLSWEQKVTTFSPDIVIHTAWQIREMYGKKAIQHRWNVEGSARVFDFVFSSPSVKKLIHFSTVASYAAFPTNSLDKIFTEKDPFRQSDYLYAEEKRVVEDILKQKYEAARGRGKDVTVTIIRPAAITGPRGRYMRERFGLQSLLSGNLKSSPLLRFLTKAISIMPATNTWCRQFVHEDDIAKAVELVTFSPKKEDYDVYIVCPPGPSVLAPDMSKAVGKRIIMVPPYLIRIAFFFMWHLSRGRIPTSRGGWKSYSYPIVVDGSKISKNYGLVYSHEPKEAFVKKEGRYMKYVKAGIELSPNA